ncbi:YczE/YyaS/YitT family protein [Bacillus sp. B-jedd]|uniref:YczE/YyaS/YitT family protein n=1 Tax=Bacillus sp. B-jedd TaxID=1476857 RepID=UPI0005156B36|nr:YitT family protein [Bacillus sp. B-jedd]CEG27983.1 integral inner membrane protein regulating antibiotic production [Bacillus sp. B-jedd]
MFKKRKGQLGARFSIYTVGLLVLSLGIVLLIKSGAGASPWDVFHVGLYLHFGLTVGSWSIIAGMAILTAATIIAREFPHIGAFLNMVLVGVFIDIFMPFINEPSSLAGEVAMLAFGVLLMGYGMGIYISASLGTGPRDSLMAVIIEKTGWKVRNVRGAIELAVLLIGWKLGGPVSWGTIAFCAAIGPVAGLALPQSFAAADWILDKLKAKKTTDAVPGDRSAGM